MFARNVSFHLKSNMLADYRHTLSTKTFFRYFAGRTASRTKLRSPAPAESMSLPLVCGTIRPVPTPTTPTPTRKC